MSTFPRRWGIALFGLMALSIAWGAEEEKKAKPVCKVSLGEWETTSAFDENAIRKTLESPVTLQVANAPLVDVIDAIHEATKVEMQIDRNALKDLSIALDTPVTFHHKGLRLRHLLDWLLRDLDLAWVVHGQVLLITTPDRLNSMLRRKIYDVRDLVAARDEKGRPTNDFDQLIQLITTAIPSRSRTSGGEPGSIMSFEMDGAAVLVVRQDGETHAEIEQLLKALRALPIRDRARERTPRRVVRPMRPLLGPASK